MHCVMTVRQTVGSVPGIASVDADPNTKNVTVRYDPAVITLKAIEEKLSECGYPVAK